MTSERLEEIKQAAKTRPTAATPAELQDMIAEVLGHVYELRAEKGRLECPLCQRYMHCPYEEPPTMLQRESTP